MSPTAKRPIRERLLSLAPGLAATWAGFWGLVTWNVITESAGAGAVIGSIFTIVAAALPAAMLYMRRHRPKADAHSVVAPLMAEPVADLPPEQRRLLTAYQQVKDLVASDVIDGSVLRGLDERIDELGRLLAADSSNQALGGRPSQRLEQQTAELTELLVGVADAALDRRTAFLDSDDAAASSLRDALEQMRAEEQGYREVDELDDKN